MLPFPPPGDLPAPGVEPATSVLHGWILSGKLQLNIRYLLNVFSNVHQREMEIMETRKERLRNVKSQIIWCNKHLSILESENLGNAAGH